MQRGGLCGGITGGTGFYEWSGAESQVTESAWQRRMDNRIAGSNRAVAGGKACDATFPPNNDLADPSLKQNEGHRENKRKQHQEGDQEHHYQDLLRKVKLGGKQQRRERKRAEEDTAPIPPSLVSDAVDVASLVHKVSQAGSSTIPRSWHGKYDLSIKV